MGQRDWLVGLNCSSVLPYLDVGVARACEQVPFAGHVNFGPATYEGTVRFKDWQGPHPPLDDDLDFYLFPRDGAGLTAANDECETGRYIEVEINNGETEFRSDWWKALTRWATASSKRKPCSPWALELARRAAAGQRRNASSVVGDWLCTTSEAKVIGILSLDSFHGGKSELHPVFGVALHDPTRSGEGLWNDDLWVVFAQNAARQGEFGKSWHYLDVNQLTFRLEGPPDRVPVSTSSSLFEPRDKNHRPMVRLRSLPGFAVVTIELPREVHDGKLTHVLVDGELHLQWKKPQAVVAYENLGGSRPALFGKEQRK